MHSCLISLSMNITQSGIAPSAVNSRKTWWTYTLKYLKQSHLKFNLSNILWTFNAIGHLFNAQGVRMYLKLLKWFKWVVYEQRNVSRSLPIRSRSVWSCVTRTLGILSNMYMNSSQGNLYYIMVVLVALVVHMGFMVIYVSQSQIAEVLIFATGWLIYQGSDVREG